MRNGIERKISCFLFHVYTEPPPGLRAPYNLTGCFYGLPDASARGLSVLFSLRGDMRCVPIHAPGRTAPSTRPMWTICTPSPLTSGTARSPYSCSTCLWPAGGRRAEKCGRTRPRKFSPRSAVPAAIRPGKRIRHKIPVKPYSSRLFSWRRRRDLN